MASAPKRIGGDWVEAKDPTSGKTYYANLVTKETSWTYPTELGGGGGGDAPKSEDIWVERQDPKSGRSYFYNKTTKERTWTRPTGAATVVAAEELKTENEDKSSWVARQDPNTGRTYYYHKVTKERRWHLPGEGGAGAGASEGDQPPEPINTVDARSSIKLAEEDTVVRMRAESKRNTDEDVGDDGGGGGANSGGAAAGGASAATTDRFAKLRQLAAAKGMGPSTTDLTPLVAEASENVVEADQAEAAKEGGEDDEDLSIGVGFYSMEEYVKEHFNLKRKGFFGKETTVEKVLNWKDELIKKALHPMPDRALDAEAVQAFKNIVSYMGERKSSKDDIGHATKLLGNSVHAPEIFRDELFCQLIKQTRGNPDGESTVKGWQLMAMVAGAFPPSRKLEKYLMSYCNENTKDALADGTRVHPGVKPFAKYTMMRIKKSKALGPRKEVPTAMEIQAAKERQPVVIRVHLLNGHYKTVPAECWTTIRDLNQMVAKKLKIQDPSPFATFEVSSNDEERVLDEDDRVLDLLSYWQREFGTTKKGKAPPTFQFIFKMRLFFDIADTDTAAIDLAYIQAVHDVTDSRYPCNEDDCLTLAALQAQETFGDYNGTSPFKENGLVNFLPAKYLKGGGGAAGGELEGKIIKIYQKLKGYSTTEAKLNYLDYVKSWKIYGSTYFFVEPQNSRDFPSDVVLAVNAKGILVVDPETKDFLAEYPYSEVVTWGSSAQSVVLVVGNLIRQTKIYFRTDQGAEVNGLVHAYVQKLMDRDS